MTTTGMSEKDLQDASSPFNQWLVAQIGLCKWVVARSSKRRRDQGYDRFFTQERFAALRRAFEKETIVPQDNPLHLTEPNSDLAQKIKKTPPGMAYWAGTGPTEKTCRECKRWDFDGYLVSSGLLKDTTCDKYTRMMNGERGGRLPHYTPACKYFELDLLAPAIEKK